MRDRMGLRIGAEMSRYFLRRARESDRAIAVIGGDARTGIPRRQVVDPQILLSET